MLSFGPVLIPHSIDLCRLPLRRGSVQAWHRVSCSLWNGSTHIAPETASHVGAAVSQWGPFSLSLLICGL